MIKKREKYQSMKNKASRSEEELEICILQLDLHKDNKVTDVGAP
jgi:hypothetical protein